MSNTFSYFRINRDKFYANIFQSNFLNITLVTKKFY